MEVAPVNQLIYAPSAAGPIRQGEIISALRQYRRVTASQEPAFDEIVHPFAIVITQDCDLDWDFRARADSSASAKTIPSILFCEAMLASDLRPSVKGSDIWKRIYQNKDERYQCLEAIPAELDATGSGVDHLAVDFKRYFTLSTDDVYDQLLGQAKCRSRLVSPYLLHFCGRFWSFQGRVALPREHSISV